MNKTLLFAALTLAACTATKDDSGDTGTEMVDTADTADTGTPAMTVTATWATTGVTLAVANGTAAGYQFGMAETGSDAGWFGEDCINDPDDDTDYGYELCHPMGATGGTLVKAEPYTPDDIVAGESTLFTDSLAANITYVLFEDSSDACWTWGEDVSYYAAFGCTEI